MSSAYHKLSKDSPDSVHSQLDLFAPPYTQTSILKGDWFEETPVRESPNGVIEFDLSSSSDGYLDLSNSFFAVHAKVLKDDGSDIPTDLAEVKVIPVNNFLHSNIAAVSVSLNGHEIEYGSSYPYRSWMEDVVNSTPHTKSGSMEASLFSVGSEAAIDKSQITGAHGSDIAKRKSLIAGSRTVDMIGRLHCDIFSQPRLLMPNCEVRIKIFRSSPEFALMKTEDDESKYKIDFTNVHFLVRRVEVHPSVVNSHNTLLGSKETVKYPMKRIESQAFSITAGRRSERIQLFSHKTIPQRVFITLCDHQARNGSYELNPFRFRDYGISSFNLVIDGQPFPHKPLTMDVSKGLFTRAWVNFLTSVGMFLSDDNGITRSMFGSGYTILAFDLTGDLSDSDAKHLIKQGNTSLELIFKDPTPHTISVNLYGDFEDILEIAENRTVSRSNRL